MLFAHQEKLTGKPVGIVFGTFAPMHQGHLDVIMRAKKECDGGCVVIVSGRDEDRGGYNMPLKKRYRYIREFFADDSLVAVYAIYENELGIEPYPNGWDRYMAEVQRIFAFATEDSTPVFYVSEPEYADHLCALGYQCVLLDRNVNQISATMIRNNPIKYWDKITYPFRRVYSTNILICGTASEGKTTLVRDLGKYFNAPYSHEYARDYMADSNITEWELEGTDYLDFLTGQYHMNKKLINSPSNHGIFFADSDSMTTRTYAEYYHKDPELSLTEEEFKEIAVAADAITKKCRWDKIYLVCPHGVFVDDHTRYMAFSGMNERQAIFNILCENIKRAGLWDKVTILDGGYWQNFETVKNEVKEFIEHGKMAED